MNKSGSKGRRFRIRWRLLPGVRSWDGVSRGPVFLITQVLSGWLLFWSGLMGLEPDHRGQVA